MTMASYTPSASGCRRRRSPATHPRACVGRETAGQSRHVTRHAASNECRQEAIKGRPPQAGRQAGRQAGSAPTFLPGGSHERSTPGGPSGTAASAAASAEGAAAAGGAASTSTAAACGGGGTAVGVAAAVSSAAAGVAIFLGWGGACSVLVRGLLFGGEVARACE